MLTGVNSSRESGAMHGLALSAFTNVENLKHKFSEYLHFLISTKTILINTVEVFVFLQKEHKVSLVIANL